MSENQNIEWKSSWRDEFLKWICGFANSTGGNLIIGKNDNGEVIGIENAHKLMEDIPNKTRDTLGIIVDIKLQTSNGKDFIDITVEAQPFPVNYKGQYYIRSGSTNQELKGKALDKFLLHKNGKRWDAVPIPNVNVSDLKKETFDFFRKKAINSQRIEEDEINNDDKVILENLQLFEGDYLKRASILLFHPNPEKYITGAYVKIGYFKTDTDLIFQDEIHGNLFEQIDKTFDLLFTKYLQANISYDGLVRTEKFDYSKEAVREALLNAICHKDYSDSIPVQISVYDEKIIFWNEGQLPENWTVENLLVKHPSKPFNPDIANALFRSGYIESWGRGTLKMMNECMKFGVPKPIYYYDMSGFWVEFWKEKYSNLNDRQKDAIAYFKNKGFILTSEYVEKYNITDRTARRDLLELVERAIIYRTGTNKNTKYYFENLSDKMSDKT